MNLSPFEHQFVRTYKDCFGTQDSQRHFLIAVSGGADSVACLHLFHQFRNLFKYQFRVAHVHHGFTKDLQQRQFRDRTKSWVKDLCAQLDVEYISNEEWGALEGQGTPTQETESKSFPKSLELNSEQQLRDFRYEFFKQWLKQGEILVLGHHIDDLLETQLMDLLRGSHFEHWKNLSAYANGKFRPLSQCDKKDIVKYLSQGNKNYIEDPSNSDVKITRNWLRHELLGALEQKFPGAKLSLSKNLKKLYEYQADSEAPRYAESEGIPLWQWMLFSYRQKQKFVLSLHLSLVHKSLTQGQIEEVIRHLDQRQKDIKFQTGPIFWVKNAEKIYAHRENI